MGTKAKKEVLAQMVDCIIQDSWPHDLSSYSLMQRLQETFGHDGKSQKATILKLYKERFDFYVKLQKVYARKKSELTVKNTEDVSKDVSKDVLKQLKSEVKKNGKKGMVSKPTEKKVAKKAPELFTTPELNDIIKVDTISRTAAVQKLWEYILENDLLNPANKREVLCDEKLHELSGLERIHMLDLNKELQRHLLSGKEVAAKNRTVDASRFKEFSKSFFSRYDNEDSNKSGSDAKNDDSNDSTSVVDNE